MSRVIYTTLHWLAKEFKGGVHSIWQASS